MNSKWIIDPNVRTKTVALFKENIGVNLHDLVYDKILDIPPPKAQEQKKKK